MAGGVREGEELRLFPGGRRLLLKSVEAQGDQYRLRIKGIPKSAIETGGVLVSSKWPVSEVKEALLLPDGAPLPDVREAVRGGVDSQFNKNREIGRAQFRFDGTFARVRFPAPYPLFPGARISILTAEGQPREFTVLYPGLPNPDALRRLKGMAKRRPHPHPSMADLYGRLLHACGYTTLPPMLWKEKWDQAVVFKSWAMAQNRASVLERRIKKAASRPGGIGWDDLNVEPYPHTLVKDFALDMVQKGQLVEKNGWCFPPGEPPLSPFHRGILKRVEEAGEQGIRVGSLRPVEAEACTILHRTGHLVQGEHFWLGQEAYQSLSQKLLNNLKSGDELSMADARAILGGSRSRTLDVLELLEHEGLVRRDGDVRIVL